MKPALDFSSQGWKHARDDWNKSVLEVRQVALTDIEARPAWVPELDQQWNHLAPLLDEVEYRGIPRDADLWRRVCPAIQSTRDVALTANELNVAAALDRLFMVAVLFGQQAVRDESPL